MRYHFLAFLLAASSAETETMTAAQLRAALDDPDIAPVQRAVAGGYLTGMMETIAAQAKAARTQDRALMACPPPEGSMELEELQALIEQAGAWSDSAPRAVLRGLALKWPCS